MKMGHVVYGRRSKRINLQRSVVGLFAHFPKEAKREDLLVLFDNLLWCQDKSASDPDFAEKFGLHLKVLAYILKQVRVNERDFQSTAVWLSNRFLQNFNSFAYRKREVKNVYRRERGFVEIRRSQPSGVPNSKLPPERYIGKGYGDKGTAKKPELDGSPSWQEIAMHRGHLYD